MRYGELFAGYGGIGLALESIWPDARPAWFVEFDQAPSKVLAHHWPDVPNHGDITAVDWDQVEPVDVLTGGFPCQDLSHAGKRLGLRPGTRSGLWEHMAYAIDQLRPRMVVIENVRGLLSAGAHSDLERDCWCVGDDREPALRALGAVLGDLADLGYDAEWVGVRAADAGAPHGRFRVFVVAHPAHADDAGLEGPGDGAALARRGAADGLAAEGDRASGGPRRSMNLLPTPKASDGPNGGPGMRNGRGDADALPGVVALLPTPVAMDAAGARNSTANRSPDAKPANIGDTLSDVAYRADFGPYAAAVARWEAVLGRPAPPPTEPGRDGRPRLSPRFVEWMMGLPTGWVTDPDIGLTRAQQLKALGNGVVPQQAELALRMLLGLSSPLWSPPSSPLLATPRVGGMANGPSQSEIDAGDPKTRLEVQVALLPTPAVNDMGEGKDPATWDDWTDKMRKAHGNGNGHGKSPAIEAMRLADD